MKSLLIGFFQVLCFIQVYGHNQLNTYPSDKANSFSSVSTINFNPAKQSHDQVAPAHSGAVIKASSSIPPEETELIFENIEEETEDFSPEKHFHNNLYFADIPVDQSLDYLYGNGKNSSMFCEQLSFITFSKRHLVFQVFRI
ncbi:MAG: hypothetical protein K0S23_1702 [Fluviicola sp.]|jgi:hypothetical protein|uniref:hypothetical protein n=1 Tax=Fluviicola sp. TaxID=1917219 RepID=UPI00260C7B4B|nr:hypothetical protein [Fluviicola sp.]MDF3027395.1 hypothetical protein [Fluviicola sp.]